VPLALEIADQPVGDVRRKIASHYEAIAVSVEADHRSRAAGS